MVFINQICSLYEHKDYNGKCLWFCFISWVISWIVFIVSINKIILYVLIRLSGGMWAYNLSIHNSSSSSLDHDSYIMWVTFVTLCWTVNHLFLNLLAIQCVCNKHEITVWVQQSGMIATMYGFCWCYGRMHKDICNMPCYCLQCSENHLLK